MYLLGAILKNNWIIQINYDMGSGSSTQKINTSQNNNQPASNDDVQTESPKQEDSANAKKEDEVKLPAIKTSSKVEPQHSQKNVSTSKLPQVHSTSDVTGTFKYHMRLYNRLIIIISIVSYSAFRQERNYNFYTVLLLDCYQLCMY